ncbi:hypothetical protein IGI04_001378, partial [Brassica rapa subsp. trilocularis]
DRRHLRRRLPLPRQLVIVFHRLHPLLSSPCLSSLLGMSGSDGVSSAGNNWNQRVFVSSGPPARRDRSVIALGALDLFLVADCAWIWVKSKIRDPPEASTSRAVSLLLRRLAPAGAPPRSSVSLARMTTPMVYLSEKVLRTTLRVDVSCGKSEALFCHQVTYFKEYFSPSVLQFPFQSSRQIADMLTFWLSSVLTWAFLCRRPPPAELRGVSQALLSMPARSHFGEARSNSPSSLDRCFKPVD